MTHRRPLAEVAARAAPEASAWPVELAGSSPMARRLRERVQELAQSPRPALIVAPSGFDAAAVAATIHALAGGGGRLLTVDCSGEEPPALEARLFGPPNPRRTRFGLVETVSSQSAVACAGGGTLVVLAVHELPVSAQARLARVLRDGEVRVNGSARPTRLDLRVVATSELPLDGEVQHGRFRSDLLKRFGTRQLVLVPLRDRREDIAEIAAALMARAAAETGGAPREFTRAAFALVAALGWDGNVSDLEALVRELAGAGSRAPVRVEDVLAHVHPGAVASVTAPRVSLREARRQFEREYIAAVLKQSGWRMGPAARVLGIQRTNLYRKARQLGIARRGGGQ